MDEIDRTMLRLLVEDGRLSVTDLADAVELSLSAASQRLRRLRESGAIERFTVRLGAEALGRPIDALVDLELSPGVPWSGIDDVLRRRAHVVDAVHVTGGFDYQVRVRTATLGDLDQLLQELKEELGVRETSTRIVLATVRGFPREPAV